MRALSMENYFIRVRDFQNAVFEGPTDVYSKVMIFI